ncbi:MAG: BrnT family toxin [Elusimicrobia bacterium]|nr:BrnT family toxin [Elusimicrobiota bacterium]
MRLQEIVWTPEIEDKVRTKHGLQPEEVGQVCLDRSSHFRKARDGRYAVLGRTEAGRYVLVIGAHAGKGTMRIITARDMTDSERDLYERHA